jgi:hypothetical protein
MEHWAEAVLVLPYVALDVVGLEKFTADSSQARRTTGPPTACSASGG